MGVVAPEILPPLGVGPATFDASASVITASARTCPPSTIMITGVAVEGAPSAPGVAVSVREQRSQPMPERPSVPSRKSAEWKDFGRSFDIVSRLVRLRRPSRQAPYDRDARDAKREKRRPPGRAVSILLLSRGYETT